MTTTEKGITPEASKRICAHMNNDHAATVHALVLASIHARARRGGSKVQNCRMKSVSLSDYTLSYVLCEGDACSMQKAVVPFRPGPLASADQVRPALIAEHHRALQPDASWLVTDPLMRMLFGACLLLGAGTALGQSELAARVDERAPSWASSAVAAAFGSSERFAAVVVGAFWFSVAAHGIEALYTAYLCRTILKMDAGTTAKWFVLNVCTGFPIMNKITELVAVDRAAREAKKH